MRGGYSQTINSLREQLIELTSLLELELDFGEEDVEFADRTRLKDMLEKSNSVVRSLASSFHTGNAIRNGVSVAIVGAPNVGKSTLLNALVGDDRAMVSNIAGTTRDTVEESIDIDGILFRFIDTAGLRTTDDQLEQMGIERTRKAVEKAQIVINMTEPNTPFEDIQTTNTQTVISVVNKSDTITTLPNDTLLYISARNGDGVERLRNRLRDSIDTTALYRGDTVVSNLRHYEALTVASESLDEALAALATGISTELLSEHIRTALTALGEITGHITSDTILQSIFSSFCIGK